MWSAPAVQWSIDVLRYLSCGLECADLLQETADDIEATLITVRVLAVGPDSNPIEDQNRGPKRTASATDIRDRASRQQNSEGAFLCVSGSFDPGCCDEDRPWPRCVSMPGTLLRGQTGLGSSSCTSRPRQCHPHQRLQVEFGIDQCRSDRLVPKHIGDILEGCTAIYHRCCRSVA